MNLKDKNLLLFAGAFIVLVIGGLVYQLSQPKPVDYQVPSPQDVVRQYFESWNNKDWPNMYAAISDGFKKIDPNAKNLEAFRTFASSQGIEGVNILSIKETSNDGTTANVAYSVEFVLSDGSKRAFSDRFTLKFRQGDIIQGWKLIHPYGHNVDTS